MIHLSLLLTCMLSVEMIIRSNFLLILDSILKVTKKVIQVVPQNNISDHWKEKVVPVYAFRIFKHSFQIFFIILFILSFFIVVDFFIKDFLVFTLSSIGVIESLFFAFGYVFIRKLLIK